MSAYLSEDEVLRLRLQGVPVTRELRPGRCCARCKTPYNCGNAGCGCHLVSDRNLDRHRAQRGSA